MKPFNNALIRPDYYFNMELPFWGQAQLQMANISAVPAFGGITGDGNFEGAWHPTKLYLVSNN